MIKDIMETFSPSGCEEGIRNIIEENFRDFFDSLRTDNMGNIIGVCGNGKDLCIECNMDTFGVMVVANTEGKIFFAAGGTLEPKDIDGKTVVFENGAKGIVKHDGELDLSKAKLKDLYIESDCGEIRIGDFGAVEDSLEEKEGTLSSFNIKEKAGLLAVCRTLGRVEHRGNITVLFSAQKRLGGRGLNAFFGANNFRRVILVDSSEMDGEGCFVVVKDKGAVSSPEFARDVLSIAEEKNISAVPMVSEGQFYIDVTKIKNGGDEVLALGIPVSKDKCLKQADLESTADLIAAIINKGR